VSGDGATGALDQGWETAEAADDGEQELRRSSGGASCSGRRKAVEMQVRECKSEFMESSGTCFRSRRGLRRARTAAGCVACSGGGGATWRGEDRASRGREAAGAGAGGHVARSRAARGQLELGKMAGEGGGVGRREEQR
jgi:hypothetical protein